MRVRWLDQAVADLKTVRTFIAQNNPSAAADVAKRIREAVRILADYPASGRAGRVPNTRELVVTGTPYILPYRVRAQTIEIFGCYMAPRNGPTSNPSFVEISSHYGLRKKAVPAGPLQKPGINLSDQIHRACH